MVNLMAVDVQRLMEVVYFMFAALSGPIQIGIAMYFIWQQLGKLLKTKGLLQRGQKLDKKLKDVRKKHKCCGKFYWF